MFVIAFVFLCAKIAYGQDSCRTPNGDAGTCILLDTCTPLKEINRNQDKSESDILFLRQSSCGLHLNIKPKVCCPPRSQWPSFGTPKPIAFPGSGDDQQPFTNVPVVTPPATVTRPDESALPFPESDAQCPATVSPPDPDSLCCGQQVYTSDKITGGKIAGIDQFPWLALLEYDSLGTTGCGGALISARYVLTASHCLGNTRAGTATKVRLAEFNTTTYPTDVIETNGEGHETITVVVIRIERQIVHPDYKANLRESKNDIGLVRLIRDAPYTEFIRPICLPIADTTLTTEPDHLSFYTAGWGLNGTVPSEVKQWVQLPFVPHAKCQSSHAKHGNSKINENHICAGGELGKDSCGGDSGGPLMEYVGDTYLVVGIVSFGPATCGTEGVPGVYTNVFKYLDWIKKETK